MTRRTKGRERVFVLAIRRRVREERVLDGLERRGSENAFGGGERGIESEKESGEEVNERETEEF